MAHNLTAARPYAKALFSLSEGDCDAWVVVLSVLSMAVTTPALQALLNDPNVSEKKWRELLLSVVTQACDKAAKAIESQLKNFLALLIDHKRLMLISDIQILYQQLLAESEGIEKIEAISAYPLSQDQAQHLAQALEKRLNATVDLSTKTDKELIGGVLIRSRNWVLDYSLKDQLMRLEQTLLGG